MVSTDINELTEILAQTKVEEEKGVNFAGRSLKLDSEKDAEPVVDAIKKCPNMTSLRMEGNTVGVEAAKAIAKALESQPDFKKAFWKDMFTGRLKDEIPEALNYLSSGIMLSGAKLVELDLSDNAFGPVGIKGILLLLKSSSCYSLQVLKLNNNGLGIGGGKMLAEALLECHKNSKKDNMQFSLKTFICGRNRLENEGSKEIAKVFEALGSLECVCMPQNGINHEGISALSKSLALNKNLREINLNDNICTEKGAKALAKCINNLSNLEIINFGDCLIKTEGAKAIADSLKNNTFLKELNLGFNEIGLGGGIALIKVMANKKSLQKLDLDGNNFGTEGCKEIQEMMTEIGQLEALGSLGDDDGTDDDDEDDDEDDNDKDDIYEEENEYHIENEESEKHTNNNVVISENSMEKSFGSPTAEKIQQLGLKIDEFEIGDDLSEDEYMSSFIKISSAVTPDDVEAKIFACLYADKILSKAFKKAEEKNTVPLLTNTLLVHLGLIKSEDKSFTPPNNLKGPLLVLEHAVKQKYFSKMTKDVLQLFLSRPIKAVDACGKIKHSLMRSLYQF
ncbi:ran GTPase-activating protein 1-like isoform X1 [Centruroides sculpturatus]|uniref:ran GTPase-activating protein 1-like isoform X1 n=1 Tax=Centruroides sculpturatus TaxID=218467 RepID=UPI000C6D1142|nr:ran GTPase-activating protein 1-like isoform X1 [Centruroides sculpturatus]